MLQHPQAVEVTKERTCRFPTSIMTCTYTKIHREADQPQPVLRAKPFDGAVCTPVVNNQQLVWRHGLGSNAVDHGRKGLHGLVGQHNSDYARQECILRHFGVTVTTGAPTIGPMPPPLVHIGYYKTGTTWLQREVFDHPASGFVRIPLGVIRDLLITPNALDFDESVTKDGLRAHVAPILEANGCPVLSFERLSGSPYSGGYDSSELAGRIRRSIPDARVLIVLREQQEIILSTYLQYVRMGGTSTLERFLCPPHDGRIPLFHLDHFRYDRLIARYQALFGAPNVCVLAYEQLRRDAQWFLRQISAFAGCPPAPDDVVRSRKQNLSLRATGTALLRWLNHVFGPPTSLNPRMFAPFSNKPPSAVRAVSALTRPVPRPVDRRYEQRLQRTVAQMTSGYFSESNRRTTERTGLELDALGYEL